MNKKRKHRQYYRVLVIPDDKDEPKAFNVPVRRFKMLKILGIVLAIHLVLGFVFYVQYYRLYKKNKTLVVVNKQLTENNAQINKLMADFESLESHQDRINRALGINHRNGSTMSPEVIIPEENTPVNILPDYGSRTERRIDPAEVLRERHNFLQQSKHTIHEFEKSVPTLLPVDGVLSADYENESSAGPAQHRGIDIAADKGKLVNAAADGVVVFSGWTYDLGNLIIIYHGNGFYTYYGHNQQSLKPRGSLVKKGEPIALLGNSGISSAPHLHFEIWKDGVSLDPKDYILAFADL
mgnify:CR=1 FL=1